MTYCEDANMAAVRFKILYISEHFNLLFAL